MTTTMTIRLEPELKQRLDQLAEVTHRSKSYLAAEALREFVELNEWQLREVKDAIKEADEEDFASQQTVAETLGKWGVDAN
jgi:RHH-type transcriptional regulator, rel operon repressor / antitoxin RelB